MPQMPAPLRRRVPPYSESEYTGTMRVVIVIGLALLLGSASDVDAKSRRSTKAKRDFVVTNPCPSTGKGSGRCPSYIVDHVIPLCAGGADRPSNMQWQTVEEAKIKDREERKLCAKQKGPGRPRH